MIGTLERPATRVEADTQPVISMVDVGMTYPNGKVALADVNVVIPAGDFVFLVGPSGAGKSTFIRLLIREQLPTAGRVVVAGRDLARMRRTPGAAAAPADRDRVPGLPPAAGQDGVRERRLRAGGDRRRRGPRSGSRVPQLLNLVGLHEHDEHLPTQLSGGEQQRVAIARALVHDPAMLIADEPTGNLDPVTSWEIIQLLIQINELGTTVLMATHNQEIVNAMRRRVLALEHGTLVRDESGAAYEREY